MERIYIIPLRKEVMKAPEYKRAKKAITALKAFLMKHMKVDEKHLRVDNSVNKHVWSRGIKNPILKVKVKVTKDDKGVATAVLFGAEEESKIIAPKEKAEKKEAKADKKAEPKKEEKKPEAAKAEPKPAPKPAAKPAEKKPVQKTLV